MIGLRTLEIVRQMNILKTFLFCFTLFVLSSCAGLVAEEQKKQDKKEVKVEWSKGDSISVFYICRTEKDIMDVALADAKNTESLKIIVWKKTMTKDCLALNPPLPFIVTSVLGSYVDSEKRETSILSVTSPVNNGLSGYLVATGKPVDVRGSSF